MLAPRFGPSKSSSISSSVFPFVSGREDHRQQIEHRKPGKQKKDGRYPYLLTTGNNSRQNGRYPLIKNQRNAHFPFDRMRVGINSDSASQCRLQDRLRTTP